MLGINVTHMSFDVHINKIVSESWRKVGIPVVELTVIKSDGSAIIVVLGVRAPEIAQFIPVCGLSSTSLLIVNLRLGC